MSRKLDTFNAFTNRQKSKESIYAPQDDQEYQLAIERENKYRNYLREESQKLRNKWQKLAAQDVRKRTNGDVDGKQNKMTYSEEMYKKFATMNAEERQRAIHEVEEIIWRDTVKPRELHSAALLSEVLKMQEKQRQEMRQVKMLNQEKKMQTARELLMQSQQWCEGQRQRTFDERKRAAQYKKDLQGLIEERERMRQQQKEQQLAIERKIQKMKEEDLLASKTTDRKNHEKKQKFVHKHALEALKIKEDAQKSKELFNGKI